MTAYVTVTVKAESLGGGRYRVRVYDRDRRRQVQRTFQASSAREVKRLAAKHEAELRGSVAEGRDRRTTLAGLIDEWSEIRDRKDSPSTVRKRQGMLRRIRTGLGHVRLEDLTARHVDRWMAQMADEGLTSTTVANHWSCLRAILRQGKRWKAVRDVDAAMDASPPKRESNRRPAPPTRNAAAVLIDSAKPDLRIAAMLGAQAGLRRGEVLALCWPDIEPGVIHVRRALVDIGAGRHTAKLPKSGRERDVKIGAGLLRELMVHRAMLEERARQYGSELAADAAVLPKLSDDPSGRAARPLGWLTLAWSRHAERMGAGGIRFHDLRHFYATEAIDAGIPMPVVQRQLGHTLLSTTQNIYTHAESSAVEAAAELLDARWALANRHDGMTGGT